MVTTRLFDISCFLIHLAARLNSILHAVPSHSKHIGYLCKHNLLAMQGSSLAVASAHRENLAIRSDVWVYQCADNCTESIVVYGAARPLRVLRDSFFHCAAHQLGEENVCILYQANRQHLLPHSTLSIAHFHTVHSAHVHLLAPHTVTFDDMISAIIGRTAGLSRNFANAS